MDFYYLLELLGGNGETLLIVIFTVLGVLGLFSLLAVLFGILGRKRKGLAITGLVFGVITLILVILVALLLSPVLLDGLSDLGYFG